MQKARFILFSVLLAAGETFAQTADKVSPPPAVPDPAVSVVKVLGALALVLGVFLAGVWMFRNWQRIAIARGGTVPKLSLLEVKHLGNRHALYVVGYQQQRMLVAASPTGVTLVSHLPEADPAEAAAAAAASGSGKGPGFGEVFQKMLRGGK